VTRAVDASLARLGEIDELGHEARASAGDHAALRLWLRLLACTTQIEDEIRKRLRARFGISLARFDYLAQLHRQPKGLRMKDLSRCLMVTGGNITGLTDELEREGYVARVGDPLDRRAWILRLTPKGRSAFEAMAREHEAWIVEILGGLDAKTLQQLHQHLGDLRVRVAALRQTAREDGA
jgi:DNA-binding MarR family transcriptional regulator